MSRMLTTNRTLLVALVTAAMVTSSWAAEAATKSTASATKLAVSSTAEASQPTDLVLGDSDRIDPAMPVTPDGKYGMMTITRAHPGKGAAANERSSRLYIVDLDSGIPREVVDINLQNSLMEMAGPSPDSTYGLVSIKSMSSRNAGVYAINLKTGKSVSIPTQESFVEVSWVGNKIAINEASEREMLPLKLGSADGKEPAQSEFRAVVIAASRDGKIWVGGGNPDDLKSRVPEKQMKVVVMSPEGKVIRQLGSVAEFGPPIVLSPSGSFAAGSKRPRTPRSNAGSSRSIVVVDVMTGQTVDISEKITPLAVTDDGRLVAFERQGSGNDSKAKISIYDAAGIPTVLVEDAVCVGVSDKKAFYCIRKDDTMEFGSKDLPPAKK